MSDISVLYLSNVITLQESGEIPHTHDYWHFCLLLEGAIQTVDGHTIAAPSCYCYPAGTINNAWINAETCRTINALFLVHNQSLSRKLEAFPFASLREEDMHIPFLVNILEQAREMNPGPDFIDVAFSYYLQLLLVENENLRLKNPSPPTLCEQVLSFIEENYMHQIRLEDAAQFIKRTPPYVSFLVRAATGETFVENLREVRIKNACHKLAYSSTPLDEIITSCGFSSASYFHKTFKERVGITPNRYRCSHSLGYTYYTGDPAALDVPYDKPSYTYVPKAQKCVMWATPGKYFRQEIE